MACPQDGRRARPLPVLDSKFPSGNEQFFARSRKSRDCAETYLEYVAQTIPQIDTEIVEKGRFQTETKHRSTSYTSYRSRTDRDHFFLFFCPYAGLSQAYPQRPRGLSACPSSFYGLSRLACV